MERFTCARCHQAREGDVVAARNAFGDREYVCVECLSPDELGLLGESMDEVRCIAEGLWTVDELARGDHREPEVMRVALERRMAADPAAQVWARPIHDRVVRHLRGEGDSAFLE